MIQDMIQTEIFVKVSVLGDFSVTWLKMLMSTKNIVIRRPIRPGTTSRGITKLIWNTTIKVINNYNRWNILLAFYNDYFLPMRLKQAVQMECNNLQYIYKNSFEIWYSLQFLNDFSKINVGQMQHHMNNLTDLLLHWFQDFP